MEGPEDTLPTPFDLLTDDFLSARHNASQPTRSLIELAMIGLSATLREKPEWWHKYKLADVRARWRNEALEQGLSEAQTDYVLDELAHYDSLRVEATGIEVSCCDGIWQSDQLIAPNIGQALRDCVKVLEDVSEGLKDWHPRSNGLVLDLVHPSLYPLVYGRTLVRSTQPRHEFVREALELTHRHAWGEFVDASRRRPWRSSVQLPLDDDPNEWTVEDIKYWLTQIPESEVGDPTWLRKAEVAIGNRGRELLAILANWRLAPAYSTGFENSSERFAWLPTDFDIDAAGRATALAYINNLHPANSTLTKTVVEVLSAFVPLFERVLSDLRQPHPLRVRCFARRDHRSRSPGTEPGETDEAYNKRYNEWYHKRDIVLPSVPKYGRPPQPDYAYDDALSSYRKAAIDSNEVRPRNYDLRSRRLQVIVKLANIILTPEKPDYPGGSWHVEGMLNERIVASGIYYYDEYNISESRLAFRTAVREPRGYEQSDVAVCLALFGIPPDGALVQSLGSVQTKGGRCIAFPNVFQHCVSPFRLADPSAPGHRKILAFFLVDPQHTVPSTSTVAMQQRDWVLEAISSFGPDNRLHRLPRELLEMIADSTDTLMTREEAFKYREELMDERTQFVSANNEEYFGVKFNMCEH